MLPSSWLNKYIQERDERRMNMSVTVSVTIVEWEPSVAIKKCDHKRPPSWQGLVHVSVAVHSIPKPTERSTRLGRAGASPKAMPAACASRTIPLELAAPSRRSSKEFLSSKKRQQNRYIHSSILSNYNCLWPSCSMSLVSSLKRVLFEAMKSLSLPARRYRSCFRPSEYRRQANEVSEFSRQNWFQVARG
jgi:hypothetical protein